MVVKLSLCVRVCVCVLAGISGKIVLIRVVECLPLGRVSASQQGISLPTDTLILYSSSDTHTRTCGHTHTHTHSPTRKSRNEVKRDLSNHILPPSVKRIRFGSWQTLMYKCEQMVQRWTNENLVRCTDRGLWRLLKWAIQGFSFFQSCSLYTLLDYIYNINPILFTLSLCFSDTSVSFVLSI